MLKYNWYFVYSIIFAFGKTIVQACFRLFG